MNGTETCHLKQVVLLPAKERRQFSTDLDADLDLALEYFKQELFTYVRGEGLAYGARIWVSGDESSITFNLYRASNVPGAYKVFR